MCCDWLELGRSGGYVDGWRVYSVLVCVLGHSLGGRGKAMVLKMPVVRLISKIGWTLAMEYALSCSVRFHHWFLTNSP